MQRLPKDDTGTLTLTLNEKVTISNPEFLFEFTSEDTDNSVYAIISDTSSYPARYNTFSVEDAVTVTFEIDGYYIYNVYEQANGSGNLDPDGLTVVEHGRLHVYLTDATPDEYTNTSDTNSVYEPE